MLLQVFGHAEALDLLISKDGSHGLIRSEPLLGLRVLQTVLLDVVPDLLDTLQEIQFVSQDNKLRGRTLPGAGITSPPSGYPVPWPGQQRR